MATPSPLSILFVTFLLLPFGCVEQAESGGGSSWSGEVIVVPRMSERPVLDAVLGEEEWAEATLVEGEFVIDDGTIASGVFPFKMWIGYDDEALHVAVLLPGLPDNPWDEPDEVSGNMRSYGQYLNTYFMMGHEGPLTPPADWLGVGMVRAANLSSKDDGYWNGHEWVLEDDMVSSPFNKGRPEWGRWARAGWTDEDTFIEFYIHRKPNRSEYDGLDLTTQGAEFRLSLMLDRHCPEYEHHLDPWDTWPSPGYSPEGHLDADTWLRLRLA